VKAEPPEDLQRNETGTARYKAALRSVIVVYLYIAFSPTCASTPRSNEGVQIGGLQIYYGKTQHVPHTLEQESKIIGKKVHV